MTAEIVDLSRRRREILFSIADHEAEAVTHDQVAEATGIAFATVATYLPQLAETPLVDRVGPLEGVGEGRDPIGYRLTDAGRRQLERHVRRRVDQVGGSDGPLVERLEQRETSADRVLEDAFCVGCGAVYAGDGYCEDCRDQRDVEEDLVA